MVQRTSSWKRRGRAADHERAQQSSARALGNLEQTAVTSEAIGLLNALQKSDALDVVQHGFCHRL